MDDNKENAINFLLNHFMDRVVEMPYEPRECVRFAITACLRFATRAALRLNIPIKELERQFQEELAWSESDIRSSGSGSGSGVLN